MFHTSSCPQISQARNLRALGDVSDFKGSSYGANRQMLGIWVLATQIFFIFTPIPGEMIQFDDHIFQMDWNHQLGMYIFCVKKRKESRMTRMKFTLLGTTISPTVPGTFESMIFPTSRFGGICYIVPWWASKKEKIAGPAISCEIYCAKYQYHKNVPFKKVIGFRRFFIFP